MTSMTDLRVESPAEDQSTAAGYPSIQDAETTPCGIPSLVLRILYCFESNGAAYLRVIYSLSV